MNPDLSPKGVLILHAGALGDCVLTFHLVSAIRQTWCASRVTMVARSPIAKWASDRGLLCDAISHDEIGTHHLHQTGGQIPDDLISFLNGFDLIINLTCGPDETVSKILVSIAKGRVVSLAPQPTSSTLRGGVHIVTQWIDHLRQAGIELAPAQPATIATTSTVRTEQHQRLELRLGVDQGPILLVHPGSGGLKKCCPLDALEVLVRLAIADGWQVGWIIGPDEVERFGSSLQARLSSTGPVLFEESVTDVANLLCGAAAYVGNDAGMTHVALLCGVETTALFGPTDPRVWRPLGTRCYVASFPAEDESLEAWAADVLAHHAHDAEYGI